MGLVYKRKSKEFVCPHCKKDFNKENSLKKHIADSHKVIQTHHHQEEHLQEDKGWR